MNMKYKYKVYENNAGGLSLFIFDETGKVIYGHHGYEYVPGQLRQDIEALKESDPRQWDGCVDDPVKEYKEWSGEPTTRRVADETGGLYPYYMGHNAKRELLQS